MSTAVPAGSCANHVSCGDTKLCVFWQGHMDSVGWCRTWGILAAAKKKGKICFYPQRFLCLCIGVTYSTTKCSTTNKFLFERDNIL